MEVGHELREWTRISERLDAALELDGVRSHGITQNISANGVLIDDMPEVLVGSQGIVTLTRSGQDADLEIRAQCEVVRSEGPSTALRLTALIGEESYAHLRNLVTYNAGSETEKADREFREHIGLNRRT